MFHTSAGSNIRDGIDRQSPREVLHQRREEWTLLSVSDFYEELDEEGEAEFMNLGVFDESTVGLVLIPFIYIGSVFWVVMFSMRG